MRIGPDVHGITILPDDGKTVFVSAGRPTVQTRSNAGAFVRALEEALPEIEAPQDDFPAIRRAIRLLNLAVMNEDPIARVVLAVSTIEGLATDPPWTDEQRKLIESAATWLNRTHGDEEETREIVEAILRVRKESIRQGIKKYLAANKLSDLWQDWDKLYYERSRLFHGKTKAGNESRGDYLEESELHSFGQEAVNLCARIVLTMSKLEGISVPDSAKVHFGIE